MVEIERKFLVHQTDPAFQTILSTKGTFIRQGYFQDTPTGVTRVRITDTKALLTLKGRTKNISRPEFEYTIPLEDAEHIMAMCPGVLEKTRYFHKATETLTFEIDVFHQLNLIVCEIELPTEQTSFPKPSWLGEDVSTNPAYYNNELMKKIINRS